WLASNAPTTDGTRMSTFLQDLFSEDIVRERAERAEMLARVRTRALTMPPTDELRLLIEKSDKITIEDIAKAAEGDAPVRKPGSVGRRASDKGDQGNDRRRESDRRLPGKTAAKANESGTLALAAQQEEAPELGIGSEIDGRYRVVELIGEGGMGKVYLAEHIEIGKRVALKVLHPSYSRMPDLVERFRREARAASKIGHPNIVDVTDSGATADGSVYFVMEYLEGVELGSVIEREGALDIARALRISGQICRALQAAHREGIIHRDLKPENIFLITRGGEADVVKVLDFGIAKTTEAEAARERRLTSPGMAMGTPEYMAPEQAAGRPADARTDVYSLGAIMYEMVTGVPPYQGDNFMEILTKKATLDPPAPVSIRSDLPEPVSDLVLAAMSRNPDSRPQSMESLEYELNKCLSGRGQAVASILGMTTDANVVATLNPGLSTRNLDSGIVHASAARAGTHDPIWDTRSGVSRNSFHSGPTHMAHPTPSGPVRAPSDPGLAVSPASSGKIPRVATPLPVANVSSAPIVNEILSAPGATPEIKSKSGFAVFGWIMLILILLGGGGALAYMMLYKKEPTSSAPVIDNGSNKDGSAQQTNPNEHDDGKDAVVPKDGKHDKGSAEKPSEKGSAETKVTDTKPPTETAKGSNSEKKDPASEKKDPKKTNKAVAALDDKTPWKAISDVAKKAEGAGDWDAALLAYQKLEKAKGYQYPGWAVYKQAWAAFQLNDTNTALNLSQRASTMPGNQKPDAKLLYADALYKQGDYKRAKDFYIGLRKQFNGEPKKQAQVAKKITACNQKLKLPDNDGLK
ncbi:MAG TPA: serine/threonine-protein kinase, partial [Kofleriaceae bacterium]|nr:serine/threonine-protein kinase [Kofleriaceae bacterium]